MINCFFVSEKRQLNTLLLILMRTFVGEEDIYYEVNKTSLEDLVLLPFSKENILMEINVLGVFSEVCVNQHQNQGKTC
jgi:hypothetical protein